MAKKPAIRKRARSKHTLPKSEQLIVVEVKAIPPVLKKFIEEPPPGVPDEVVKVVKAIQPGVQIVAPEPVADPTFWQSVKDFFSGE